MDACPHCQSPLFSDATICLDCGASFDALLSVAAPPLPVIPGVKLRLISSAGRPLLIVPKKKAQDDSRSAVRQRRPFDCEICKPWRDIGVPLVGLAFVISFVLGVAAALDVVGVSAQGLAILAVPVAGALQAESVWLAGRWRAGLVSMFVWDALLWTVAIGPLFA